VVFVHGWTSSPAALRDAGAALQRLTGDRITPYYFDYSAHSTTWAGADVVAGCLAGYLQAVSHTSGGKVLVVAHSMGGLAVLYAAARGRTADTLGGVVTFDTPFLGSPFADSPLGGLLEGVRALGGVSAPPAGSDAQVCLGLRPGGAPMPAGCDYPVPPYLPAGVPLTEIAGEVTISRGPLRLADLALGSDVIVPASSAHGYLDQTAPALRPRGAAPALLTDACTVTDNDVLLALSSAGWTPAELATLATGAGELVTSGQGGPARPGPTLLGYLLAAEVSAPCSHTNIYHDPAAQRLAAQALVDDLDS
jgi:pimeloyl-ACP methyl ester carboxylesterase